VKGIIAVAVNFSRIQF